MPSSLDGPKIIPEEKTIAIPNIAICLTRGCEIQCSCLVIMPALPPTSKLFSDRVSTPSPSWTSYVIGKLSGLSS